MTEVENLLLEHHKRFPAQMARFEDKIDTPAADFRGVKQRMAAFMTSEISQDGDLAAMKLRLERIERRLDLID
jgi:hypothetical protein